MGEKTKKSNFLGIPFLSIHEGKSSAIILVFTLSSLVALYQCIVLGDIPVTLFQWLGLMLGAITGININERYNRRKEKQIDNTVNEINSSKANGDYER